MTLTESVEATFAAMPWLQDSDRAAMDLALSYARRIDEAVETGEGQEVTKALYLGPHLLNTLRALGGTPSDRRGLKVEESAGGTLLAMQQRAQRRLAG